jgi:hypothetical protein
MGVVRCGNHKRKCCWRCDGCPSCNPAMGKLLRGDYCRSCTEKFKAEGRVWCDYYQNWVTPEDKAAVDRGNRGQAQLFMEEAQ